MNMNRNSHFNVGLALKGINIKMPSKLNIKQFCRKRKGVPQQDDDDCRLLDIQSKHLNRFDQNSESRASYSSRKGQFQEKRFSEEKDQIGRQLDRVEEQPKQEISIQKRYDTNHDYRCRKVSSVKVKKCICGDCEQCLKDFTYFLQIFSHDQSVPEITAKSWCIWRKNKNNKFMYYYGKRIHKVREIASLTKMIAAMTVIDFMLKYEYNLEKVTYQVRKSSTMIGGTSANLKIGEVYTIEELLYGLMLPSGNDAAIVLSQAIGLLCNLKLRGRNVDPYKQFWYEQYLKSSNKSYAYHFISLMNERCERIGLLDSHMYNSHGNDAYDQLKNISTCNEIAKISGEFMLKYESLRKVVRTKFYEVPRYSKYWENTNKLLEDGFDGIKTGITDTAGPCLAACYKDLIIVVLNSKSMNERWIEVKKLVRWMVRKGLL